MKPKKIFHYCDAPNIEDSYRKTNTIDGELLDTAGQDQFRDMWDEWIRESQAFLFVYSINRSSTLSRINELYEKVKRVKENELKDLAIVVVGNKVDLEKETEIPRATVEELTQKWKEEDEMSVSFFEVSAKTEINNEECFREIVRLLRKNKGKMEN